MARQLESKLQCQCVAWFRRQFPKMRRKLFAIPNGAFLQGDAKKRAMRWAILEREGANAGTADLFLSVARGDFHGLYIEMKTPSGTQSKEQIAFEREMIEEGYGYAMPRTFEEFQRVVGQYLKTGKY